MFMQDLRQVELKFFTKEDLEMKKLVKSRYNRNISGVCGGIGEYFDLDPTLIRIAFILITLMGGSGVLLYLACALVMPESEY